MGIEKIFESLDEKVFTAELKESMIAQFNEAVEAKVSSIVEEKLAELEESKKEFIDAKNQELEEKSQEFTASRMDALAEGVERYLDRIVEEFVASSKESLQESLKQEKADLVLEAFESMVIATGVDVARIREAKDSSDVEKKLEESIAKYDALMSEHLEAKAENEKLIKLGLVNEAKEGLSLLEAEKFDKAIAVIEFTKSEEYAEKLAVIKESVIGAVEEKKEEVVVESVETKKKLGYDFSHLI